jgi:uncharacterized protein (TIGR02466 family)
MELMASTLFPTLVWTAVVDNRESLNAHLEAAAYRLREKDRTGVANTNMAGWQSRDNLQDQPEFSDFLTGILQIARQIGESQNYLPDAVYRLQAWVNINPPSAWNQVHIHPDCHLSGCYYVRTPPDCGGIYFRDPRKLGLMTRPPIGRETHFTATEARMRPEAGRLYVFPSWLEHGVEPNRGSSERISIAFNVQALPPRQAAAGA